MFDFSNPAAVEWWKSQMDVVLSTGADGWKCDATVRTSMDLKL